MWIIATMNYSNDSYDQLQCASVAPYRRNRFTRQYQHYSRRTILNPRQRSQVRHVLAHHPEYRSVHSSTRASVGHLPAGKCKCPAYVDEDGLEILQLRTRPTWRQRLLHRGQVHAGLTGYESSELFKMLLGVSVYGYCVACESRIDDLCNQPPLLPCGLCMNSSLQVYILKKYIRSWSKTFEMEVFAKVVRNLNQHGGKQSQWKTAPLGVQGSQFGRARGYIGLGSQHAGNVDVK